MIGFLDTQAGAPPDGKALWETLGLAERCFDADGFLRALGLAHRPQQSAVARAAAAALFGDTPLLAEAGTGVGKSLAYLIPGILASLATQRPLVVSTHTIALQQQLLNKDIPLCKKLFESAEALRPFAAFKTAILMGRAHYLCTTRLARAIETKSDLFDSPQQRELERIVDWAATTQTGLVEELNPPPDSEVWEWVNADSNVCAPKRCGSDVCFYQRARKRAAEADVRILNHSLLFALVGAGAAPRGEQRGVLFPNDRVVLDEAHLVPDVATEYFGTHLSSHTLKRFLHRLYNAKTKRGVFKRFGTLDDCNAATRLAAMCDAFFEDVRARHLSRETRMRLYAPQWGDTALLAPLQTLAARIGALIAASDNETNADELRDLRAQCLGLHNTLEEALFLAQSDCVYWVESAGVRGDIVHVQSAPVDVAPHLRKSLFERGTGVVLTSATLDCGDNMEHFKARLGADGRECLRETSPFDYARSMRVFIARDAAVADEGGALDIERLAEHVGFCARAVRGGTLALFTSRRDMRAVADRLRDGFAKDGRLFLVQGEGGSRTKLAERFARAGNGVLFGTDSFWTGIDIPGAALSQVIITRLPFDHPNDPLLEARCEWVQSRGGNAFQDIILPETILKFRQGLGRLIRTETDSGTLTLLDSRILTKPYGGKFLAAIPVKDYAVFEKRNRAQVFRPLESR